MGLEKCLMLLKVTIWRLSKLILARGSIRKSESSYLGSGFRTGAKRSHVLETGGCHVAQGNNMS